MHRILDDGSFGTWDGEKPFETIYYDEPDFLHECPKCGEVTAIPIHSMIVNPAVDSLSQFNSPCFNCHADVPIEPRLEPQPDGRDAWTVDRESLAASGLKEWKPEESFDISLVHKESGELIDLAVSNSKKSWLVVCDDCGLPFEMTGSFAVTNRLGAGIEVDHLAGPCEHCGGFGHPLVTTAVRDGLITQSNSVDFAENVLSYLAEQVRSGNIDVSEAAARLRAQKKPHLTRLADWIEAHPTNAMVAATLIAAVASLVGPQLPSVADKDEQPPSHTTNGYSEKEVVDLVDTILDHYDKRAGNRDHKRDGEPPASDDSKGGKDRRQSAE